MITTFTPQINNNVFCIDVANNELYFGGDFTTVNTLPRSHLASINISTGILNTWNPNVDNCVLCMTVKDSVIYVGGTFNYVGTQYRNLCVSLYLSNGLATTWDAKISPQNAYGVFDINVNNNKIYVGGSFEKVNNVSRKNLVAYDFASGNLINGLNAKLDGSVKSITSVGTKIYIVGNFTTAFSQIRNSAACFNSSNVLQNWNPSFSGQVSIIAAQGTTLLCGGLMQQVNVTTRQRVAKINLTTMAIEPWNVNFNKNGFLNSMVINGNNLYIGGDFDTCNSQARRYAAALNINTGALQPWNPVVFGITNTLASFNNTIYMGGEFSKVGSTDKVFFAAVDNNLGSLTSLNISTNKKVTSLSTFNNKLFVGGYFEIVNIFERNGICALNHKDWSIPNWNAQLKALDNVYEIIVAGNIMYACGTFTTIGGKPRHWLGAINITTGLATTWNPYPDSTVYSIAKFGNKIFAGGAFQKMNVITQKYSAALKVSNGTIDTWPVAPNYPINKVLVLGNKIWQSGHFLRLAKVKSQPLLFSYNKLTGTIDTAFHPSISGILQPNTTSAIRSLFLYNNTLFCGGNFDMANNSQRLGLAAFDKTTGVLLPFQASFNDVVNCLEQQNGKLYVGGDFYVVNGITKGSLCALDINTANLLSFNPNVNYLVLDILAADSTLYIGGGFNIVGGVARNKLAAFDLNTGVLRAWNPNVNEIVRTISNDGNNIFIGGDFTTIGGISRNRIASIKKSNGTLNPWNVSLNNSCNIIIRKGNELFVGGIFDLVNGNNIMCLFSANAFTGMVGTFKPPMQTYIVSNYYSYYGNRLINTLSFGDYSESQLKVGGLFNSVNNIQSSGLAAFSYYVPPSPNTKISLNTNSKNITQNILSCYPNPANEKLYVTTLSNNPFTVSVKNISGAELIHKNINGGNLVYELDITSLNSGIYFITYTDGKLKSQSKFVKQ